MSERVVVLGAGFGGLELSTMLSEAMGGDIDVTLIDKSDAFMFGFSKLDVMFGRTKPEAVRLAYRDDREARRARPARDGDRDRPRGPARDHGCGRARGRHPRRSRSAPTTTWTPRPGLADGGNEFYSLAGAERLAGIIPSFSQRAHRDRRLRGAVQVPPGAERVRTAPGRRADRARGARRLPDLVRDPVGHARCRRRRRPPRPWRRSSPSAISR